MTLADRAGHLLGAAVLSSEAVHGGDLSEVVRLRLADGKSVIAKSGPAPRVEAEMLAAIAGAGAPAPRVLAADDRVLVLDELPHDGRSGPDVWAGLGQALLAMHSVEGNAYGWQRDYAFGRVAIPNGACADWPEFWGARRLDPAGLPADLAGRLERLRGRLGDLLPARPLGALLHGDLWTGNLLMAGGRLTGLIDPACYHGHGEVALAMLHLFGGPGPEFAAAYGPPEPGWEERRAVYQLWPALVHLRLFGGGYRGMVERLLGQAGA